ncbi:MAG: hypothetical protein JST77_14035 [Acidobacteria bacterium]|nr:hypothetical protein [Acidobacteriota bacterium]
MLKRKHSEAELIGALKQMEAGRTQADVAQELGASEAKCLCVESGYGGLDVHDRRCRPRKAAATNPRQWQGVVVNMSSQEWLRY